ncbi:hypothetical protein [Sinomonas sp. P47F7]|uniref:hypothetical protein n=1 Tax=Sinomonas sp. P47F7 TaxID=3410987 RepID=UPI003BF5D9FC
MDDASNVASIWTAVGATATVTSAATGVVVNLVNRWDRRRRAPEADWAYTIGGHEIAMHGGNEWERKDNGKYRLRGRFANCGDASAFRLTARAVHGTVRLETPSASRFGAANAHPWIAVLEPGESISFHALADPDAWADFRIELEWITSPTRLKKRVVWSLKPSEVIDRPVPAARPFAKAEEPGQQSNPQ